MKPLEVVCAIIIDKAGNFLACQRGPTTNLAGKWEFPGGKIEAGETKEIALKREIREELQISISNLRPLKTVFHQYPNFEIALSPFLCKINNSELPNPTEHAAIRWVNTTEADTLDWAEADLPILEQFKKLL